MSEPLTPPRSHALIEGPASDQVAAGNYLVQLHPQHGAVASLCQPGRQPVPRLRALPVILRPRPVHGLVDREEDLEAALIAVGSALPVEIHGPPGTGKSTLLRALAHTDAGALRDGVIHLSGRQQPAADLVQSLFEAFYDCDTPFKPSPAQARQLLHACKALVLVDDCELGREAAQELLDTAPGCAFVLASPERCLWGEGRVIHLRGLPVDDARVLFERELGRQLTDEEGFEFETLWTRLEGQPLRLLQAAAQAREDQRLTEVVAATGEIVRRTLAPLPDEEKRLLSALAACGGGPVGASHLPILADVPDPAAALDSLLDRRLVESHSPRYSLTGDLAGLLDSTWDLSLWRDRALAHFLPWADARRADPAALAEEGGVLRHLLAWAVQAGRNGEALRLGRTLEAAAAVSGRWDAWEQILAGIRQTAQALGDRAAEAWALHQLGTRFLCLDDQAGARELLGRALAIRESLGDQAGAAVSRHNLGLLGAAPPAAVALGEIHPRSTPLRPLPWLASAVLAFLVIAAAGVRFLSSRIGAEQAAASTDVVRPSTDVISRPVTTDIRIEETEPTPPATTDQPLERGMGLFEVSRDRVEFSTLGLGASSEPAVETLAVTNAGDSELRVAGVSFTDNPGRAFAWRSNCQQRPVPPGGECAVHVLFQPTAAGSYSATLAIDTDRMERRTVEISGAAREEEQQPEPEIDAEPGDAEDDLGWCCAAEGQILATSEEGCAERGGAFFRRRRQAQVACGLTNTGCCLGGSFELNVPADQCALQGGVAMTPGEALVRCRPPVTPPPRPR